MTACPKTLSLNPGRVAQDSALPLARSQRGPGAFEDHPPPPLGQRGIDVRHGQVRVGPKLGRQERHPLRHQPGDEVGVAAQPVSLATGTWPR